MTGRPGRTGTPKWKKDLKKCESQLRKTLKMGHLERRYEELCREDLELHRYWEQNGSTLIELILRGPRLVLHVFRYQRRSILAFVKWWPVEFGDISVHLLQKDLLRLKQGQMQDTERIGRIIERKERWQRWQDKASCERQKLEQKI